MHPHPLRGYVPNYGISIIDKWVHALSVHFKVVPARKTKLGDCRYAINAKTQTVITLNDNLQPIQFLVTALHELAHSKTFREQGHRVSPHGKEWQNNFKILLAECIEVCPNPEHKSILQSVHRRPAATSGGNELLQSATKTEGAHFLKDLNANDIFEFRKRTFKKIKTLRTQVICEDLNNKRHYKIHGLAEVIPQSSSFN